jgi:hypothetical protein
MAKRVGGKPGAWWVSIKKGADEVARFLLMVLASQRLNKALF